MVEVEKDLKEKRQKRGVRCRRRNKREWHTWEIHSTPARHLAEQDRQQDRKGLKMQGGNQWAVSTAKWLNLEILGTEQRPVLSYAAECCTNGCRDKTFSWAHACVLGSSSSSHPSVPAPFIPCFKKERVAQGRCVLSPNKAWEGVHAGSWGCRAAMAQVLPAVGTA